MAHDSDAVPLSESGSAPVLHVQLLGNFRLVYGDQPVTSIEAPRLQALLAYLLLHRDAPQSRQHIAFLLYPDSAEAQARTNLRNQMHYLRKALPAADRFLIADAQTLQWNSDAPFTLDVDDFENSVAHANSSAALREAVNLYGGELLPGCYDDWILPERERLRQKFVETLERLILLLENQRDFRAAISFTERLLRQDPLREETYRHLMRLYVLSGDSAGARRVYQTCVAVLKRELDAEPSQETRAEFERLFNQAAAAEKSASAHNVHSDVSPPKTIDTSPNNLPVPLTSFIGREQQIADLKRLLSLQKISSRTRLVTFTGAGGSGKTRLALQVANELLPSFQDGAWFVDLAPLFDPALIPQAIASALSVHEQPGRALLDTLLDSLRGKELLLLLDNCEQFVAACAEIVRTLLEKCPRVQIIATSRERLNLAGETVWLVPTLSLPDAEDVEWIDASHSESARLFVERALSALPTFALTRQNAPAVAQICRRLDGIPLAIELAAARIKLLTPAQIASRLDDAFRLLTRASHAAPPRQQTLRAAMDWSYELLSAPEQMLFRQLSVFAGGFTLESAEGVCGDNGRRTADDGTELSFVLRPDEILDLLSDLVDKSLVVVSEWEEGEQVRYRMLEPVRQYAGEMLGAVGEEKVPHRHMEFFLRLANETKIVARVQEPALFHRFEQEHENLCAALSYALGQNASHSALEFCDALDGFWETRGYWTESRIWFERVLEALDNLQANDPLAPARLYRKIGKTWNQQRHSQKALSALRTAESALGHAPNDLDWAWWREWLELQLEQLQTYYFTGEPELMLPQLERLGPVLSKYGTADQRGRYFANRVRAGNRLERYCPSIETVSDAQASLAAFVESGNLHEIADASFRVGFVYLWHGDLMQAETHLRAALKASEQNSEMHVRVLSLSYLAVICRRRRQDDSTKDYAARALETAITAKMPSYIAIARANLGWVAYRQKNMAHAETEFRGALNLWETVPSPFPFKWLALMPLLAILLLRRQVSDAIDFAHVLLDPLQAKLPDEVSTRLEAASQAASQNQDLAALTDLRRAIQIAKEIGYF